MANVHSKQVDQQALYKLHDQMSKELAGKVHDAVKDGKPAESPIPGGQFENFTTMLSHADQIAQANLIAGETVDPKALAGRVFNTEFHTPSGLMPQLNTTEPLKLSEKQMEKLLVKMPCPFMGNMVKEGKLPVFGSPEQPIIKTEDIIKASGQGSLGEVALEFFATGNQTKLPDALGQISEKSPDAPQGFISAQLIGSQGDHPHVSTGLFKTSNPQAAAAYAEQFLNADGKLDAKGMGQMVAHRLFQRSEEQGMPLLNGPILKSASKSVLQGLASGFKGLGDHDGLRELLHADFAKLQGNLLESVRMEAKAVGTIPTIGKAGEFGLWLEANGPVSKDQLEAFIVGRTIPQGFEDKEKGTIAWAAKTTHILAEMVAELVRLKNDPAQLKKWPEDAPPAAGTSW